MIEIDPSFKEFFNSPACCKMFYALTALLEKLFLDPLWYVLSDGTYPISLLMYIFYQNLVYDCYMPWAAYSDNPLHNRK